MARRAIGTLAMWCLIGGTLGGALAVLHAVLLDSRINSVLASQVTARAMDQVRLGVVARVHPADFAPPHSSATLADLQSRLDPVLQRLSSDDSGVLGVDLIAPDGVIIYSDQPGQAGRSASQRERAALRDALDGRVVQFLDSWHESRNGTDEPEAETFDVYVPVLIDGGVVGAYEMDLATTGLRWNQPFAMVALGAFAAGLVQRLRQIRARRHTLRIARKPVLAAPGSTGAQSLTRRELEVLELLADGHSYRQVAQQLVVSEETVRSHVKRILRKTGQANRTAAVAAMLRAGAMRQVAEPELVSPSPLTKLRRRAFPRQGDTRTDEFTLAGVANPNLSP